MKTSYKIFALIATFLLVLTLFPHLQTATPANLIVADPTIAILLTSILGAGLTGLYVIYVRKANRWIIQFKASLKTEAPVTPEPVNPFAFSNMGQPVDVNVMSCNAAPSSNSKSTRIN